MFKIRFRPNTHSPCSQGPAWISLLPVPVLTTSASALTHTGCRIRMQQAEPSFPGSHSLFQLTRCHLSEEFLKNSWVHLQSRNALPRSFSFYQHSAFLLSYFNTGDFPYCQLVTDHYRSPDFPVVLSMLQINTCHSSFKAGLSMEVLKKGTQYNKCNR